ncbi:hypothetical protein DQ04_21691000 [Trypanosoma grayi]|uniref:hypothetical protein n=1 Tax=Trypanosoma grayi TaxID=71804 RepID=UPI0004F430DA|nr:hypothetical protein DQ04_21691000 [Trypanosoma grayi]KEG05465.1 hypothetical protein DQ04_21691000 [Trypanosoma grayi]
MGDCTAASPFASRVRMRCSANSHDSRIATSGSRAASMYSCRIGLLDEAAMAPSDSIASWRVTMLYLSALRMMRSRNGQASSSPHWPRLYASSCCSSTESVVSMAFASRCTPAEDFRIVSFRRYNSRVRLSSGSAGSSSLL